MTECPVCGGSDLRLGYAGQDQFGKIVNYRCVDCGWDEDDGVPEEAEEVEDE